MSEINWKRVKPLDLKDALAWCTRYAKAKHNRSIDQIADLMGVKNGRFISGSKRRICR